MTTLLKQAFAAASQLPDLEQDDLGARLLREIGERTPVNAAAGDALEANRWIAEWRAWAAKPRPASSALDDSRESIYAGRGE